MTWAGTSDTALDGYDAGGVPSVEPWLPNRVSLVEPSGLRAMGVAAAAHGYLWVQLEPPGPEYRGRLGLYIEASIEAELEARGALPPGVQASTGLDASLSDQLYRSRLVEQRGLALGVPSLEGIANLGRTLDADDSAVLRWWMAATAERPVWLVVSARNTTLRVYPAPVLFETLFEVAPAPVSPRPPCLAMAESAAAMDLSDLPPEVELDAEVEVEAESAWPSDVTDVDAPYAAMSPVPALLESACPPPSAALEALEARADDRCADDPEVEEPSGEAESALAPEVAPSTSPLLEEPVDLPELDLALGLVSAKRRPLAALSPTPAPVRPRQLTLGLARTEDGARDASEALVTSRPLVASEALLVAEQPAALPEPLPLSSAPAPLASPVRAEEPEAASPLAPEHDAVEASAPAPFVAEPTLEDDALEQDPALENAPALDAEEFLRVLAEDSERAPAVAAALEAAQESAAAVDLASVVGDATSDRHDAATPAVNTPTPLPTKHLRRNPFVRLARDDEFPEAVPAPLQRPAEAAVASAPLAAAPELEQPEEALAPEAAPAAAPRKGAALPAAADESDPFYRLAAREWRSWEQNLTAARGPKPLAVVERMYVTDYTRLREAVRRGIADASAIAALDEWRRSFAESYTEAFDALRVRGKRPSMVLDLPEMSQRVARLHGARRVQLLLVDGMRFDLGLMIQERMKPRAEATLAERLLLWSALPTETAYQLELLGKGPDGLKEPPTAEEPSALVARGRAALTPRRVRTGHLELLKLDVIEDGLRDTGVPVAARMGELADLAAESLCTHLAAQPPRTLVVVFGDHGFALDPSKAGTSEEVVRGGASPEEVLVPAFSWLTGAVH
jgi:hypothetical protein